MLLQHSGGARGHGVGERGLQLAAVVGGGKAAAEEEEADGGAWVRIQSIPSLVVAMEGTAPGRCCENGRLGLLQRPAHGLAVGFVP